MSDLLTGNSRYHKLVEAVPTLRNRREIWKVNHSGSGTVLKTVGTLTGMEFDSASLPPKQKESNMSKDCGCGRSPTGKCIGWHGLTNEQYSAKLTEYEKKNFTESAPQLLRD